MEINVKEVKAAGEESFPKWAKVYGKIAGDLSDIENGVKMPSQPRLQDSLVELIEQARIYFEVSGTYLEDCGDTLVEVAEDYGRQDEANAYGISDVSVGIENEVNIKF